MRIELGEKCTFLARDCKSIQQKQTLLTAFTIYLLFALKITIMLLLKEVFRSQRRIIKTICKRLIQFFLLNIRDLWAFFELSLRQICSFIREIRVFLWIELPQLLWKCGLLKTRSQCLWKNKHFSVKPPFLLKITKALNSRAWSHLLWLWNW